MANVHSTAIISQSATLADDVIVGPYAVIDGDVTIGAGSVIHSAVRVFAGVRLGEKVTVWHSASIGGDPQDLKFSGEPSEVFIGDNTTIREFVTVNRGTQATGKTVIGKNCLLMAYSHVAHDCVVGDNVIMANSVNLAGHVEVEDFAIIGGLVPVHQFVHIGKHCMIGGGYRVPKDVPPFILAAGYPLYYRGLNVVGLKRRGFSLKDIEAIKSAYRWLFQSSMNTTQAQEKIRKEFGESAHVQHILSFLSRTKRGLLPGRRGVSDSSDIA